MVTEQEKVVKANSSLLPAQSSITHQQSSIVSRLLKSCSKQESKHSYHPPSRPSKSSFPPRFTSVAHCMLSVISTCTVRSHRCLTCPRNWTSRPFAVVVQALSALPSPTHPARLLCASKRQTWTWDQGDFR